MGKKAKAGTEADSAKSKIAESPAGGDTLATDASMDVFVSLVGRTLDSPPVVAFFLTQPATARRRRRQGRTDLAGIRSLSSAEAGYEVVHRKGRIETIFLYLRGRDGYSPFRGALIAGLSVEDSRADVRRKLGVATSMGAGDEAGLWPWDRYDSEALCLHIAYGESGQGLRMLTLMSPDVAP